jgi:hypothetical protein
MNPSLLLIPDRYKAAKLYSQIPDSGDGDLTFARNSSATRVNSAGLIEKVRTNLFAYSQEFNDAYWSKSGGGGAAAPVVTANNTPAPNGTSTAEKVDLPALSGTQFSIISREPSVSGIHNASVFLKGAVGGEVVYLFWTPDGVNYVRTSCTLTTAWQRFNLSATTATNWGFGIGVDLRDSSQDDQAAQTFFVWGAQLEAGDIATDYIPTTTAAVSVGITADIPRLDYTGGGCPSLLLEPQRTNSARNSILTAANWDKSSITVTAGSGIAPTGFNEAYRVAPTTSGTDRFFYDDGGSTGYTASADYTNTIFAKAAGLNFCYVRFEIKGNTSSFVYFNLATGAVGSTVGAVPIVKSIENYGNGWYRIRVTGNMGTGIGGANNVLFGVCDADGSTFATTSGSNGVLFYGPQSELGSYPTSYIPTLGSSVTRLADNASKTGISSLIGQTEGTLFVEVQRLNTGVGSSAVPFQLNDGTNNNRAQIEISSTGAALCIVSSGGSVVANITGPTLTIGQTYKIAITYKVNDFKIFVDGVLAGSDTSGAVPVSMSRLDLASEVGVSYAGFALKQALHFNTALTSTQLATLTAL